MPHKIYKDPEGIRTPKKCGAVWSSDIWGMEIIWNNHRLNQTNCDVKTRGTESWNQSTQCDPRFCTMRKSLNVKEDCVVQKQSGVLKPKTFSPHLKNRWANSSQVLVYSSATLSFNNHWLGISCPQEGLWMGPRLLEFERNWHVQIGYYRLQPKYLLVCTGCRVVHSAFSSFSSETRNEKQGSIPHHSFIVSKKHQPTLHQGPVGVINTARLRLGDPTRGHFCCVQRTLPSECLPVDAWTVDPWMAWVKYEPRNLQKFNT